MKRQVILIGLALAALLLLGYTVARAQAPGYAGSDKCAQCHGAKYESYQHTWHSKILRPADDETVLGDFGDPDLPFSREQVVYVVGGQFSQRYLTEIDGALYVLPAQWNVDSGEWVAYHPDDWQERPYTRHCAGCHTTGYDAETGTWMEEGVQCEACHGPGLDHVALAGNTDYIVNPALLAGDEQTAICGQCHLRGHDPSGEYDFPIDYRPGGHLALEEAFIPTTGPDAFWPDGSARQHHQEYQDWLIGEHGVGGEVGCAFCHVSHSTGEARHQTRFVGDHRCVICHEDKKDVATHIAYHPVTVPQDPEDENSPEREMVCTDCHMPTLAAASGAVAEYNFAIHSHTFRPPNPALTIQHGGQEEMPNACNLCHGDETPEWAAKIIGQEVAEITALPTPTPLTPPTPVPTVTPFMGLSSSQDVAEPPPGNDHAPLWLAAGLGLVAALMALIVAVQKLDRTERRAA